MINELYQLSLALSSANVAVEEPHPRYKALPNISKKAPCVRILLKEGRIASLESVPADLGKLLRRYGDNQGFFPSMNLAPLYRIEQEDIANRIRQLMKSSGAGMDMECVKAWCSKNNWNTNFRDKYQISMVKRAEEMSELLHDEYEFPPLSRLIQSTRFLADPNVLHAQLTEKAMELLESKQDISLALTVLFYLVKTGKEKSEGDYGSLCVMFDEDSLIDTGLQTVGKRFTQGLNRALLRADGQKTATADALYSDAFGLPFDDPQGPMPSVKLAGGFDAILRTMSSNEPCQHRYGYIENGSYPLSSSMRQKLQAALLWCGSSDMGDKTWTKTDAKEIMFFYPSSLPDIQPALATKFKRVQKDNQLARFEAEAADFREYLTRTKIADPEHYPDRIQIFTLRKLDKGRSKMTFTRCTTPEEIVQQSESWQGAAGNLPHLPGILSKPWIPFPLEIAGIMNCAWKLDASGVPALVSDHFKPINSYHGMELFFGLSEAGLLSDVHFIVNNTAALFIASQKLIRTEDGFRKERDKKWYLRDTVVLLGMLLDWLHIRKEDYMNEFPFLLGQLLKASDALHELYCEQVRSGEKPTQFAGSSLLNAAAESPVSTLALLAQRVQPYIAWAKTNRFLEIARKGRDGQEYTFTVGYYLYVYEQLADHLASAEMKPCRFRDEEKAQLFIGFLASFPKAAQQPRVDPGDMNPDNENENGGETI